MATIQARRWSGVRSAGSSAAKRFAVTECELQNGVLDSGCRFAKGTQMRTMTFAACVLLLAAVALLSAGRSQEQPTVPRDRTFLSLLKVGDYVAVAWRNDLRILTAYSPAEAEERIKQESQRWNEKNALQKQLNATEDDAKQKELRHRIAELVRERNSSLLYEVTSVGSDYVCLSNQKTRNDTDGGGGTCTCQPGAFRACRVQLRTNRR